MEVIVHPNLLHGPVRHALGYILLNLEVHDMIRNVEDAGLEIQSSSLVKPAVGSKDGLE